MFNYSVNSRASRVLQTLQENEGAFSVQLRSRQGEENQEGPEEEEITVYPIFRNSSNKRKTRLRESLQEVRTGDDAKEAHALREPTDIEPAPKLSKSESELQINIELDFGWLFGWLERGIWVTMFGGVIWALAYNFSKATRETCTNSEGDEETPFNILPSLSRSMSSFRVGKFLWTVAGACVFVARLLSNHFLHRLYSSWYAPTMLNQIFLGGAYLLDTLEILTLLMIPAFSLDCDPSEHTVFFFTFICLTYTAELVQYLTRFLRRREGVLLNTKEVDSYYRHILLLFLLQTGFIAFMMTGYLLHKFLCKPMLYSIFTLGEYITVVINVRFKRDTVLFVK